jgi:flagellar basal-body rod protein FlgG
MIRSMYTAATGMESQQLYLDTISNNLSNVNTTGFKRTKIEFQDLMYQTLREPGTRNVEGGMAPSGIEVGLGVRTAATNRIFEQGSMNYTGNNLDTAIQGEGFFQIMLPDGAIAYSRDGQFKLDSDGSIITANGFQLYPQVSVPAGAEEIAFDARGLISARMPGEDTMTEVGQVELARFINPAGLKALGNNLYGQSEASGLPVLNTPGTDGNGILMPQYVEASNVQIVDEMVNMIAAQRAYEIVSKAIQVSDDMLQTTNNLKR